MTRVTYADQRDIFNPDDFPWSVHVIGLGGIGSALVFPLVKLGMQGDLHLWDFDHVEPHNIPAQLIYRPSDIGLSKAKAVAAFLDRQEAQCTVHVHEEAVDAESGPMLDGIVISGVDSMAARQRIWQAVQGNPEVPLYMDGRIGGEEFQLFTVSPFDIATAEWYKEQWLFDDSEGSDLPCAARTVIHPPTSLAGYMLAQLTLFARHEPTIRGLLVHMKATQQVSL